MTLTDANELRERLKDCQTEKEIITVLDEYGEDYEAEDATEIFAQCRKETGFVYGETACTLHGKVICCPDCRNTSPDTILAHSTELLSANGKTHFGCCACGTQFTV